MDKKGEIVVQYNLPINWAKATEFSFDHLSDMVAQLHESAYSASVKAINRFATVRNYIIGFYIVEYEQHGSDHAKYGDRLLKRLAEKVNRRGINETLLKVARSFYLNYPQIRLYLEGKSPTSLDELSEKSATPLHKLEIFPIASEKLVEKGATASHQFITPAEKIISQLSFSHIREILTVDDEFKHADLSRLNAYVSYYRENEMNEGDNPPVDFLSCTRKGPKMVEYALAGMDNKLFVSIYMLSLPDKDTLQNFILSQIEDNK